MRVLKYFIVVLLAALLLALPVAADIEENGKVVIVIDPGHGGIDGGSDKGTVPEKHYNLKLSQYLREELEASGYFEVHMTRETDVYLKYLPRVMVAKEVDADLVISMHCNTVAETWVRGSTAFVSLIEDYCADEVANLLLDYLGMATTIPRGKVSTRLDTGDSLGVYYWDYEKQWDMPGAWWLGKVSDYYSISTWSSKFGIPSIIVEHGYLSNYADLAVLDNDDCLRAMARAEADALIAYYTQHEHQFGEYETDYPSSCTFVGTESRRCTICGARSGVRDLPAAPDNHFWRQTASAAVTCENDGFITYVCQISYNSNDKGYPCTVHQYTEVNKAPGHDYTVLEDSQPTHDTDGKLHKVCNTCGNEVLELRQGEGHNWEVLSETAPTCEADGVRESKCQVCGEMKTEVLTATGHTYEVTSDTEATHTENGLFEQICEVCGKVEHIIRKAEGHTLGEVVSETLPTCTEDGKRARKCDVCGEVIDEVLAATGHIEVFSENGKESHCEVCAAVLYTAPVHIYDRPVFYIAIAAILLISGTGAAIIIINTKKNKNYLDITLPRTANAEPEKAEPEEIHVEYDEETNDPDAANEEEATEL